MLEGIGTDPSTQSRNQKFGLPLPVIERLDLVLPGELDSPEKRGSLSLTHNQYQYGPISPKRSIKTQKKNIEKDISASFK